MAKMHIVNLFFLVFSLKIQYLCALRNTNAFWVIAMTPTRSRTEFPLPHIFVIILSPEASSTPSAFFIFLTFLYFLLKNGHVY